MRTRNHAPGAWMILLLASVTPVAGQQQAASLDGLPRQVGSLSITETHRYPNPQLGTLYRYRGDSALQPDVYVYPAGPGPDEGGPVNPAREEGLSFGRLLTVRRARGQLDSFEIIRSEQVEYPGVKGWHAHAVVAHDEGAVDTHLYVFMIGADMLKVRATFEKSADLNVEIQKFVDDLVAKAAALRPDL